MLETLVVSQECNFDGVKMFARVHRIQNDHYRERLLLFAIKMRLYTPHDIYSLAFNYPSSIPPKQHEFTSQSS